MLMWGSETAAGMTTTDKLKKLFGTTEAVIPGRLYGDMAMGTARELIMPAVTHHGDHLSVQVVAAAVDWFETALGQQVRVDNQIWYWKELATFAALLGVVFLVFPLVDLGLRLFERRLPLKINRQVFEA